MYEKQTLNRVTEKIRSSVPPGSPAPKLIIITKNQHVEKILPYYELGHRDFGENRHKEALEKIDQLPKDISWHFVGHLQSNKVKQVVGKFVLIHSVDSLKLMKKINSRAEDLEIKQNILLEVNVSRESSKYGFSPDRLIDALSASKVLENVNVIGLMTMAPLGANEKELREIFSSLKRMKEKNRLRELSMGMSDDYPVAVSEGSTMVRIGRALFR